MGTALKQDLKKCMRFERLGQGVEVKIHRCVGRSEKGNNKEENGLAEIVVAFQRGVTDEE